MANLKVGIYCRLSEEDKNKQSKSDDSASIQNQKSMLIQYALERGWEIYQIYSDDDYTGADRNRPEFKKLLSDAKQQKIDIVLCKTQSRFTRELELVEKYIHGLFPIWGVRFVSIVDNADTANKGNKKSRQINGLVNEWYLEDMSDNIKSVLTNRRKQGLHIGSFAPYGYRKDPEQKGHLLIDEEAAEIVREVFTLFSQGYGKTAIARILNERGVPNPTEYKRLHGLRYRQPKQKLSTLWKYFAVSDMLVNEIYIGNMVQGKYGSISYKTKQNKPRPRDQWYIVEGTHEPIIERELWDKVQTLVTERSKPFATGTIGLFARKARCSGCGYTMRSHKLSDGRRYLCCSSRHVSKEACEGAFISVATLEQAVIFELNRLSSKYLNQEELEEKIQFSDHWIVQKKRLEKEIAAHQKKVAECAACIRELYLDKVKSVISEYEYVDFSQKFSAEKEQFESFLLEAEKKLADMECKLSVGDNRRQIIRQYITLEKLDRETVDKLIDYISIGKRIPGTRNVPIEIHWNF
ncbi:MAG: recombinase family protein [Lachnospiraceae bacterium]|nr:recombinase family protein [Lachnospiraceae bacterium]